jgi:hypothetical protein
MSRICIGIALLVFAAASQAQQMGAGQPGAGPPLPAGQGTDADIRAKHADPSAVEIPLYAGARVIDVLEALTEKGFLIKYDKKQVLPTMKLAERPKSTRIDYLLNEILQPFDLHADHNQMDGGFRVRPLKKPKKDKGQ